MKYKYYVRLVHHREYREVNVEEYIRYERMAGLTGPGHFLIPPYEATYSFSGNGYAGKVVYDDGKV